MDKESQFKAELKELLDKYNADIVSDGKEGIDLHFDLEYECCLCGYEEGIRVFL